MRLVRGGPGRGSDERERAGTGRSSANRLRGTLDQGPGPDQRGKQKPCRVRQGVAVTAPRSARRSAGQGSSRSSSRGASRRTTPTRHVYVLDTSVLLSDPWALTRFAEHSVVLPLVVISELEGKRHHPELG